MTDRLKHFLESRELLHDAQKGFRPQHSTLDAIESVTKFIEESHKRKHCLLIALDISKAFDSASHAVITKSLNDLQAPNNLQRLIQSYLTGRSAIIRSGQEEYEHLINQGCPQGSVIGPTLWLILYDSLIRKMTKKSRPGVETNFVCYADDALLQVRGSDIDDLFHYARTLLMEIVDWGKEVGLSFNASKTEIMVVHRFKPPISLEKPFLFPLDREGNSQLIRLSTTMKYLGVILDEKFNFLPHMKYAKDKTAIAVQGLCRVVKQTWGLSQKQAVFLYNRCISPMILYGAEIWGNRMTNYTAKSCIGSGQRKMLLRATRAYRTTSSAALQVICNVPPAWMYASIKHELRKETMQSILLEPETPLKRHLHPSIDPTSLVDNELNTQLDTTVASVMWTRVGEQFVASTSFQEGNITLYTEETRFANSVKMEQMSLLLATRNIKSILGSLRNVQQIVLKSPDVNLRDRLWKCNKSILAYQLYVTLKECHQKNIRILLETTSLHPIPRLVARCNTIQIVYAKHTREWLRKKHWNDLINRWQEAWNRGCADRSDGATVGRTTYSWIPTVGTVTPDVKPHAMQMITGHGSFATYLTRFNLCSSPACHNPGCSGIEESPDHILKDCYFYDRHRFREYTQTHNWKHEVIQDASKLDALEHIAQLHTRASRESHVSVKTRKSLSRKIKVTTYASKQRIPRSLIRPPRRKTQNDIRQYLIRCPQMSRNSPSD
jgi:hypothetical protein